MKYQKNQMSQFTAIYKKVDFFQLPHPFCSILPFFGETGIFPEKWQHHLKRLIVFYLDAKKYKNGWMVQKIVIWQSSNFLPKINKNADNRQNENFPKNGVWASLYPLIPSKCMWNIKKIKWANLQQYTKKFIFSNCPAHFCSILPFLGEMGIFPEKWQHHLKRLMVLYLYSKNYEKRLNGSKDSNLTIKQFFLPKINKNGEIRQNENFP